MRGALVELKAAPLSFEEGFLALMRKGPHEGSFRVAEPQTEELCRDGLSGQHHLRFAEVVLRVLARTILQEQKRLGGIECGPALPHKATDGGLGAGELMLFHQLRKDAMGRAALFGRRSEILAQPLPDDRLVRGKHGRRPRFPQLIAADTGISQGRRDAVTRVMQFLGDLTLTLVLEEIRAPNSFFVIHLNHPSSGIPT